MNFEKQKLAPKIEPKNNAENSANKNEKPTPMTLEEFSRRAPGGGLVHNNFFVYFCDMKGIAGSIYKQTPICQKFIAENPELYETIRSKITDAYNNRSVDKSISDTVSEYSSDLYQAYLIMRDYDEVTEDWDLFR